MDIEVLRKHRAFKKDLLDVIFTHFETFYIHCLPHKDLFLGKRGLLDKEKEDGVILVFGPHSNRNLGWDEDNLYCELQFSSWEHVSIPYECIGRIFDKEGQLLIQCSTIQSDEKTGNKRTSKESPDFASHKTMSQSSKSELKSDTSRVIEVDFKNKRNQPEN